MSSWFYLYNICNAPMCTSLAAALFLMWELSTPFVYARWFLYNLDLANTRLYIINGLAMLTSFFCARNLLGAFMLFDFFKSTGHELALPKLSGRVMPAYMIWIYRTACVTMTCLNATWFFKMARGAIKVLTATGKTVPKTEIRPS